MQREIDEVLAAFGIGFQTQALTLPRSAIAASIVESLSAQLTGRLQRVRLSSETARREALVSPILFSVVELSDSQLRIEYSLIVDDQLKGKLDYLVIGKHSLLVIEAKQNDLYRGFTQLAVELIALSRAGSAQSKDTILYGAVTVGDIWLFGQLDTEQQQITQDSALYRVPEDLRDVLEILTGILVAD
jgi:hypothetical protein